MSSDPERNQILRELPKVPDQISNDSDIEIATEYALSEKSSDSTLKSKEMQEIIRHRNLWSYSLLFLVSTIIISDLAIMFLIGFRAVSFDASVIPVFVGSNLAQVFALSFIVVKFLFNPSSQKYTTK